MQWAVLLKTIPVTHVSMGNEGGNMEQHGNKECLKRLLLANIVWGIKLL